MTVKRAKMPTRNKAGEIRYPWDDLEPGDSFLVQRDGVRGITYPNRLLEKGWIFRQELVPYGLRIWRIF